MFSLFFYVDYVDNAFIAMPPQRPAQSSDYSSTTIDGENTETVAARKVDMIKVVIKFDSNQAKVLYCSTSDVFAILPMEIGEVRARSVKKNSTSNIFNQQDYNTITVVEMHVIFVKNIFSLLLNRHIF